MTNEKILVVDDEQDILELISYNLVKEGFKIATVNSGENVLNLVRKEKPDLLILDLMLPGINGLDICRCLKAEADTVNIPIIILSAKGEESDIVLGLELGADDYVTKPFSTKVLASRVRAVLRRQEVDKTDVDLIKIEELVIVPGKHEVTIAGNEVILTSTEFKLLHFLVLHKGWVYTRDQLVKAVHGDDYPVTDRSIDVQIVGLRKKIGNYESYIETVRGVGYRFKDC